MNSQDYPDVVTTRGAFLVPRGNTPVIDRGYHATFASDLCLRLDALVTAQAVRRARYGDAAEQWPIGRTPPELVQKSKDELKTLKALLEIVESSSNSTTPNCTPSAYSPQPKIEERETWLGKPGVGAVIINDNAKDRNDLAVSDRQEFVSQETAEESVPKVRGRKRRRGFEADENQETEKLAKVRAINNGIAGNTTASKLKASQTKKRRRRSIPYAASEQGPDPCARLATYWLSHAPRRLSLKRQV